MHVLLVFRFCFQIELGLLEDQSITFLVVCSLDDLFIEHKLFLAIDNVPSVLTRVHKMLSKGFFLHVFLRLRNRLLLDGFDSEPMVWVMLSEIELEVADLSLSTLLLYNAQNTFKKRLLFQIKFLRDERKDLPRMYWSSSSAVF